MKKVNLNTLLKEKLTGAELGKLMLKDCITGIISGLRNKDIMEGKKSQERLLSPAESKDLVNSLTGTFNIQTYNNYLELYEYIRDISIMQISYGLKIELELWKLAFRIQGRDRIPIETEDEKIMSDNIIKLNKIIQNFYFIEAVKELIAEFTGVYEILQTLTAFPDDMVTYINQLIDLCNLFKKADILPMIEVNPISEEEIKQALTQIKYVETLYNADKLKELLPNSDLEILLLA